MSSIEFLKVRARNFRSVGNMPVEFDFTDATTLVTSQENGDGKSTMTVQVLNYVLFDKAFDKGCKKTALVNTRSNKECVGEVEFNAKGHNWLVRRGMKPNIFDILRDGVRIEDEAALKDYQAYLVNDVLGFDEKVFLSSIALGRDKYVPFVEMSLPERRNYVEQMLDIVVFSAMNEETKEKIKAVRREIEQLTYSLSMANNRLNSAKQILTSHDAQVASQQGSVQVQIDGVQAQIDAEEKALTVLKDEALALFEQLRVIDDKGLENIPKMESMIQTTDHDVRRLQAQVDSLASLTTCPTCKQEVGEGHKHSINGAIIEDVNRKKTGLERVRPILDEHKQRAAARNALTQQIDEKKRSVLNAQRLVDSKRNSLVSLENLKNQAVDHSKRKELEENISAIELELVELNASQVEKAKEEREYLFLQGLLKEDGAKAEVIRTYIPFLNQAVNKALDELGLYVGLQMDEEFNIEMKAPDRKGQTVENLSTGQRCRINLALLLAWRDIARQKSTVDSNILILDEVLENLSSQGVVDFMEMWEKIGAGTKLVVITQRNKEFAEYFDRVIKYGRKDDLLYVVSDERGH